MERHNIHCYHGRFGKHHHCRYVVWNDHWYLNIDPTSQTTAFVADPELQALGQQCTADQGWVVPEGAGDRQLNFWWEGAERPLPLYKQSTNPIVSDELGAWGGGQLGAWRQQLWEGLTEAQEEWTPQSLDKILAEIPSEQWPALWNGMPVSAYAKFDELLVAQPLFMHAEEATFFQWTPEQIQYCLDHGADPNAASWLQPSWPLRWLKHVELSDEQVQAILYHPCTDPAMLWKECQRLLELRSANGAASTFSRRLTQLQSELEQRELIKACPPPETERQLLRL